MRKKSQAGHSTPRLCWALLGLTTELRIADTFCRSDQLKSWKIATYGQFLEPRRVQSLASGTLRTSRLMNMKQRRNHPKKKADIHQRYVRSTRSLTEWQLCLSGISILTIVCYYSLPNYYFPHYLSNPQERRTQWESQINPHLQFRHLTF
jgi:hypothetical protein